MADVIHALTEMWQVAGPMGVGICLVIIASIFIVWFSLTILKQSTNTQSQLVNSQKLQNETQRLLVETQAKFVEHVTVSAVKNQEALAANTLSNQQLTGAQTIVKAAIDVLAVKIGESGCKVADPAVCKSISQDKFSELLTIAKETNEHLVALKGEAVKAAAKLENTAIATAVEEKAIVAAQEVKDTAIIVAAKLNMA